MFSARWPSNNNNYYYYDAGPGSGKAGDCNHRRLQQLPVALQMGKYRDLVSENGRSLLLTSYLHNFHPFSIFI